MHSLTLFYQKLEYSLSNFHSFPLIYSFPKSAGSVGDMSVIKIEIAPIVFYFCFLSRKALIFLLLSSSHLSSSFSPVLSCLKYSPQYT